MNLQGVQSKNVQKGEILLQAGEVARVGYKVLSGCLRSYVIDAAGKVHILQFAPEDWLIADLESLIKKSPSKIFIDALENSEVIEITDDRIPNEQNPDIPAMLEMNHKLRNNLIAKNNRLISLLSATAEEKYLEFTKTYPNLVQRLPQKLIASYLGITPEHLSYTRAQLAKK